MRRRLTSDRPATRCIAMREVLRVVFLVGLVLAGMQPARAAELAVTNARIVAAPDAEPRARHRDTDGDPHRERPEFHGAILRRRHP